MSVFNIVQYNRKGEPISFMGGVGLERINTWLKSPLNKPGQYFQVYSVKEEEEAPLPIFESKEIEVEYLAEDDLIYFNYDGGTHDHIRVGYIYKLAQELISIFDLSVGEPRHFSVENIYDLHVLTPVTA